MSNSPGAQQNLSHALFLRCGEENLSVFSGIARESKVESANSAVPNGWYRDETGKLRPVKGEVLTISSDDGSSAAGGDVSAFPGPGDSSKSLRQHRHMDIIVAG